MPTNVPQFSSSNPPFVDVHTHRRTASAGVISVPNFSQKDLENGENALARHEATEGTLFASVGLHPWFLTKKNFEKGFKKISQLIDNQKIIAIGECGLDRLKGEDLAFQTAAFEAQIRLAESASKPVVIHCVRAFNEVIALKKRLKPTIPLIIHGFNKNEKILTELIHHDFFISIGAAILPKNTEESLLSKIMTQIPLERLFFETDDAENITISEVYSAASNVLNLDLTNLKSIIYENFKNVFKTEKQTSVTSETSV